MDPHGSRLQPRAFYYRAGGLRQVARVHERKQIGYNGFSAVVLIGTIRMKTVATTSCPRINQCDTQVICAKKPLQRGCRCGTPLQIAVSPPGRQRGRDCGGCLERLLIERPRPFTPSAETLRTNRTEIAGF